MSNTINLGKVNISINEFQRISSGEHNAGEVRLLDENTLDRMNHHVRATLLNGDKISHNEVIAIKEAFVKTLSQNGLSQEEINGIRQQLGLASMGAADRTLRSRSITPLSRQQIRTILDQYAGKINNANPDAHIRTSQEIYGPNGMDADNVRRRESVAAKLDSDTRKLYETHAISQFQAVVGGKVDFRKEERAEFIKIAQDLLKDIFEKSDGAPRMDEPAVAKYKLPGGQTMEMPTGMSEAEFAKTLEDMLVRLRGDRVPRSIELDAYAAYKKLATTDDKIAFLSRLTDDAQGGLKARAIAVRILFTAGITDYATLSVVNRIHDMNAILLAQKLASYAKDTPAEQLRQDELLVGLINNAANRPEKVPLPFTTYIPATSGADFNKMVYSDIKKNSPDMLLGFRLLTTNIDFFIHTTFGNLGRPNDISLGDLFERDLLETVIKSDANAERVTPESISEGLHQVARKTAAKRIMGTVLSKAFADLGRAGEMTARNLTDFAARYRTLLDELAAINSPDEIAAIVQKMEEPAREFIQVYDLAKEIHAGLDDKLCVAMAKKLGVTPDVAKQDALAFRVFDIKTNDLMCEMLHNQNISTREDFEKGFKRFIDKFVERRSNLLDKVDALDVHTDVKNKLKLIILNLNDVRRIDFDYIVRAAQNISAEKLDILLQGNASNKDIYDAISEIRKKINTAIEPLMAGKEEIGPDDFMGPQDLFSTLIINSRDGLKGRLDAFLSKPDVIEEMRDNRFMGNNVDAASMFTHLSTNPDVNLKAKIDSIHICRIFTAPKAFKETGAARALEAGYHPSELPAIEKAFALYMAVTGCSAEDALAAVLNPQHDAHRLMEYGGRFLESVDDFEQGLSLMEKFRNWYTQTVNAAEAGDKSSITKINIKTQYALAKNRPYIERLAFEEIGRNPDANLKTKNLDSLFGMESNKAIRFIFRGYASTIASTIASLPPEKRELMFDVFDKIDPLATTEAERNANADIPLNSQLALRVLKHYDDIVALRNNGQFDRQHLVQLLYADFGVGQNDSNSELETKIFGEIYKNPVNAGELTMLLTETCGTIQECNDSIDKGGARPDLPPGAVRFGGDLSDLEGFDNSSRDTMLRDLSRPSNSTSIATGKNVIEGQNLKFTFRFSDDTVLTPLVGDEFADDVKASAKAVADKLETFCGKAHKRQLSSLYLALSQSAMGALKGQCFKSLGYTTDEHMALTFTLAKNEETGAISITYTPPEGYPVKFSWTTTIGIDGKATSTPIVIEQ